MVVDRYHGYSVYSQDQLANMLGTTGNGTGLGNNWLNVLNRNVMGRNYTVVSGSSFGYSNWIKFLTDSAIQSIYYGRGVIYDVYMNPYADNYLEGYVWGDNMYHYVAGCGYDAQNPSARKLTYVDPINDSAMRPKAQGTHTVPARMVARATHPMGAVL